jgi:hexosaminidase
MKKILFILVFIASQSFAQQIIPKPNTIKELNGKLTFSQYHVIYDVEFKEEAQLLIDYLDQKNIEQEVNNNESLSTSIYLNKKENQSNNEAYDLTIDKNIEISAHSSAGIFYGIQSLIQLIGTQQKQIELNTVEINDIPRFEWRGMHLDCSRHYFPVQFIKKYIDILALHKMNTFHWHLTDDQGWRIEIKKYPLLTEIGSKRHETMVDKNFEPYIGDNKEYEGFYTQEEIKDIVQYAAERHITIVPEIEMPGHAVAALTAYPEFSCNRTPLDVYTKWGVSDDVFCVKDSTFEFIYDILHEVMDLFPSKYIHIGGDEVPKTRWKVCKNCQAVIKQNQLKDEHELQSFFIKKIDSFVTAQGRNIIGWDEILEGGLAPNAAVMSWRGEEGGIEAAKQKHNVVMTPGSHCYFDHYQGNKKTEPLAIGGYTTLEKVYSYNPIPDALNMEEAQYVLGAQGNVWTEYIPTPEHAMYMALPRLCALSEVLWTYPKQKNYTEFVTRIIQQMKLLDELKINYSKAIYDVDIVTKIQNNTNKIELINTIPNTKIRYTINSTAPNVSSAIYSKPILIKETSLIQAGLFDDEKLIGKINVQSINFNKATAKPLELTTLPDKRYSTGGTNTLIDGIVGSIPWTGKEWLGWLGEDMEANLNLTQLETVKKIKISFLKATESWIHLPSQLYIKTSNDGIRYKTLKTLNEFDIEEIYKNGGAYFTGNIKTKYIKIVAPSRHVIPKGFQGAGEKGWMFCSEIIVE